MNPYIKICLKFFLYTRIFYISLVIIIYSLNIVKKYDLSTDLLTISEFYPDHVPNIFEKSLAKFLSYFSSYDAIHFIIIAKTNYINDNIFAFFPLFPWLIRGLGQFLSLILPFKNEFIPYMLSGFITSNVFCFANCLLLFSVIFKLTNSLRKAKICSFLFLINPGTIFYISIYSENLYLMLQLILIYYLIKTGEVKHKELNTNVSLGDLPPKKQTFFLELACLIIGLLSTRSNSITLLSLFVIPCLIMMFYKEKYMYSFIYNNFFYNFLQFIKYFQKVYVEIGVFIILCFHAFLCFIYMTKFKPKRDICYYVKRGINKGLTKFDLFDKWCFHRADSKINSFYSYIQTEYWNVGFLKQYSFNTIDRLVLALPMNVLSLYILYKIYNYFDFSELKVFNIGKFLMYKTSYNDEILLKNNDDDNHNKSTSHREIIYKKNVILNSFIIGGGINYLANFLILVFIAHPQINNRLLSGCPILYLFVSDDVFDYLLNNKNGNYKKGFAILLFFVTFSIVGCIMQVGAYGFA